MLFQGCTNHFYFFFKELSTQFSRYLSLDELFFSGWFYFYCLIFSDLYISYILIPCLMSSWLSFLNTVGCWWLVCRGFKFYMIPNPWGEVVSPMISEWFSGSFCLCLSSWRILPLFNTVWKFQILYSYL